MLKLNALGCPYAVDHDEDDEDDGAVEEVEQEEDGEEVDAGDAVELAWEEEEEEKEEKEREEKEPKKSVKEVVLPEETNWLNTWRRSSLWKKRDDPVVAERRDRSYCCRLSGSESTA